VRSAARCRPARWASALVAAGGVPARLAALCMAWAAVACGQAAPPPPAAPLGFDTATAWFHQDGDSTRLLVEVARTVEQHEVGLSGRSRLDPESGMYFVFERVRGGDEGFWMWGTRVPLDIAFVSADGVVLGILGMPTCDPGAGEDACPGHFPEVEHSIAIEANLGWFARHGLREGARVTLVY